MVSREIEPEKMVIAAPKNELKPRAETTTVYRFLNRYCQPIGERGVRDIAFKYCRATGIKEAASCQSLRHTFATYEAPW